MGRDDLFTVEELDRLDVALNAFIGHGDPRGLNDMRDTAIWLRDGLQVGVPADLYGRVQQEIERACAGQRSRALRVAAVVAAVCLALLLPIGSGVAASRPGDALFWLRDRVERVRVQLTGSGEARASAERAVAERRLDDFRIAVEDGDAAAVDATVSAWIGMIGRSKSLDADDRHDLAGLLVTISTLGPAGLRMAPAIRATLDGVPADDDPAAPARGDVPPGAPPPSVPDRPDAPGAGSTEENRDAPSSVDNESPAPGTSGDRTDPATTMEPSRTTTTSPRSTTTTTDPGRSGR